MTPFLWRRGRKLRHSGHVAGWWMELVLGEDEHGVWAAQQPESPCFLDDGTCFRMSDVTIRCYPREEWWVATLYGPRRAGTATDPDGVSSSFERLAQIYVDMAIPARHDDDGVSFVDLTLDVVDDGRGTVEIVDADEIDAEAARWGIPTAHVAAALRVGEEVLAAVSGRRPPFDGATFDRWLRRYAEHGPQLSVKS